MAPPSLRTSSTTPRPPPPQRLPPRGALLGALNPSLPGDVLRGRVWAYLTAEEQDALRLTSRAWRDFVDDPVLWTNASLVDPVTRAVDRRHFVNLGCRSQGTEGACYKVMFRGNGRVYALKKARVHRGPPAGEGVPYYMLRELEFHRNLAPRANVSLLEAVSLRGNHLFMFFAYSSYSLFDAVYLPSREAEEGGTFTPRASPRATTTAAEPMVAGPSKGPDRVGLILPMATTRRLLYHVLRDVSRCHALGVMHRNVKPKHVLLYPGPRTPASSSLVARRATVLAEAEMGLTVAQLDTCFARLSDFALVRTSYLHPRDFTSEVVTLWYRAPEVMMGAAYTELVDVWAVGCVFAEMIFGRPLFTGGSELEQLVTVFRRVGSPTRESWPEFRSLRNFSFEFPNFPETAWAARMGVEDAEAADLLQRMLTTDPRLRPTAAEALGHAFFARDRDRFEAEIAEYNSLTGTADAPLPSSRLDRLFSLETNLVVPSRDPFVEDPRASLGQLQVPPDAARMRASAILEALRLMDQFSMSPRTLYVSANLLDRFLLLNPLPEDLDHMRLLAFTALHVASKCEDVSYLGITHLVKASNDAFDEDAILRVEEVLLTSIDFRLSVPTTYDYLRLFSAALVLDDRPHDLPNHRHAPPADVVFVGTLNLLGELSVLVRALIPVRPSRVAAAVLLLAASILGRALDPARFLFVTRVETLNAVVTELAPLALAVQERWRDPATAASYVAVKFGALVGLLPSLASVDVDAKFRAFVARGGAVVP